MVEPRHVHLVATKHVMRYLKGTLDYGLKYASNSEIILHEYADSDLEGSVEDRKSTSGYCFNLGLDVISWINKEHTSVDVSTTEVEFIAACSSCSELIWLHKLLTRLFDNLIRGNLGSIMGLLKKRNTSHYKYVMSH